MKSVPGRESPSILLTWLGRSLLTIAAGLFCLLLVLAPVIVLVLGGGLFAFGWAARAAVRKWGPLRIAPRWRLVMVVALSLNIAHSLFELVSGAINR